jgi:hypothetical protein
MVAGGRWGIEGRLRGSRGDLMGVPLTLRSGHSPRPLLPKHAYGVSTTMFTAMAFRSRLWDPCLGGGEEGLGLHSG